MSDAAFRFWLAAALWHGSGKILDILFHFKKGIRFSLSFTSIAVVKGLGNGDRLLVRAGT
jgi:hypothetical protein